MSTDQCPTTADAILHRRKPQAPADEVDAPSAADGMAEMLQKARAMLINSRRTCPDPNCIHCLWVRVNVGDMDAALARYADQAPADDPGERLEHSGRIAHAALALARAMDGMKVGEPITDAQFAALVTFTALVAGTAGENPIRNLPAGQAGPKSATCLPDRQVRNPKGHRHAEEN